MLSAGPSDTAVIERRSFQRHSAVPTVQHEKFLVIVAVAMMTAMSVNAQNENLRHEISLSYGVGSIAQFGEGLGEGLGLIFSDTEYDDGFILGPISAEYFYHFNNPRLAIGGIVSYSKWDSDIQKKSGNHEKVGERNRSYWSVMPAIKWYWLNKNAFGLYSKGAAGLAFLSSTEKKLRHQYVEG